MNILNIAKTSIFIITASWLNIGLTYTESSSNLLHLADKTNGVAESSTDAAITAKVKSKFISEKLFGEADMSAMSIKVETNNGVVHLTGTADNQTQIDNAAKIAETVDGVSKVVNEVTIKTK
jgi:hyperosmotically inducible protein